MSTEHHLATSLLKGTGITLLGAARLVLAILDGKHESSGVNNRQFCAQIITAGLEAKAYTHMSLAEGFELYLQSKQDLRPDTLRDIRYLGRRLLKAEGLAARPFASLKLRECEEWLSNTFTTASQYNKGRTMLHGLFEFALRHEWCSRNIIKLVARRKIIENEIHPLRMTETKALLKTCKEPEYTDCQAAVALLIWAGLRPTELRRLRWKDIDLKEKIISLRSQCSKTGGRRQVEICAALHTWLSRTAAPDSSHPICPSGWTRKWKRLRNKAGFAGKWVQDVLRHSYASYFAKHYRDLPRLQLNMGHRDQQLLRSRYVNLYGITQQDAATYFTQLGQSLLTVTRS